MPAGGLRLLIRICGAASGAGIVAVGLSLVPLDEFKLVLAIFPDDPDLVVEVGALEVNLTEDGEDVAADKDEEDDVSGYEVGADPVRGGGDPSQGEVDFPHDDEEVVGDEEETANDFEVEIELVGEGADRDDYEETDEFEHKHQVHEIASLKEYEHDEAVVDRVEQGEIPFVPRFKMTAAAQVLEVSELLALEVLLPAALALAAPGVQRVDFEVVNGQEREEVEVNQNAADGFDPGQLGEGIAV
jgi:hypothetical protein